jgi:hypothetical protein
MSIKLMTAVWQLRILPAPKLVLLALADWANDEGSQCFPSIARIAERASISSRQAQRHMRALESDGWISIVGGHHGGRESRRYQLNASRAYEEAAASLAERARRKRTPDTSVTPGKSDTPDKAVTRGATPKACTRDEDVTQSIKTHHLPKNDSSSMDSREPLPPPQRYKRGRISHGVMCWDDEHAELLAMVEEHGPDAIAAAVQVARTEGWKDRARRKNSKSKLQLAEGGRQAADERRQLEHDANLARAARAIGVAVNDNDQLSPLERSIAQLASLGIRAR